MGGYHEGGGRHGLLDRPAGLPHRVEPADSGAGQPVSSPFRPQRPSKEAFGALSVARKAVSSLF